MQTNLVGKVLRGARSVSNPKWRHESPYDGDRFVNEFYQGRVVAVSAYKDSLSVWVEVDGRIVGLTHAYSIVPDEIAQPLR